MGLVKIFSRLLTAWVAFLYPCFASYKALHHRPVSEPELERWVKYWSIVGALVGIEYASEWLVSWVPFYWEVKTIFVLYLALPQTQGSTFLYDNYLAPYFARNESAIDADIAMAQGSIIAFVQKQLRAVWELLWRFVGQVQVAGQASQSQPGATQPASAPAAGSPADVVANLWKTYGSSVVAGLTRAAGQPNTSAGSQSPQNVNPSSSAASSANQPHTRSPYSTSGTD